MKTDYKVSLVLGSDPTIDRDGVGHYTEQLYKHIVASIEDSCIRHLSVDLLLLRPNSLGDWGRRFNNVFRYYDLLHIEYPCAGWGMSPVPGIYPGFLKSIPPYQNVKVVTTLHEWDSMHPLRKASIVPLILSSDGILLVSNREYATYKDSLYYKARPRKPTTGVIPIGINLAIPELRRDRLLDVRDQLLNWNGVSVDVLLGYFGFIYTAKQPDKMLRTLKVLLGRGVKTRLIIAGDFPADHVSEKKHFLQNIKSLGLENHVLFLGFIDDATDLSRTLSACNAVLLLFSDGVSARRSSFWMVLELGVPIITTKPPFEGEFDDLLPKRFYENLRFLNPTDKPDTLATAIMQFEKFRVPQQRRGVSPDWKRIASEHIALYRSVLGV